MTEECDGRPVRTLPLGLRGQVHGRAALLEAHAAAGQWGEMQRMLSESPELIEEVLSWHCEASDWQYESIAQAKRMALSMPSERPASGRTMGEVLATLPHGDVQLKGLTAKPIPDDELPPSKDPNEKYD